MSNTDDDTEQAAMATADEWFEAFARSPAFTCLTESQQRRAGAITEYFARYTYTHVGLSPRQWDGPAVVECCTEILPRKISADRDFFVAIVPVLSAFLAFLGEQGLLSNGRELSGLVVKLEDEIVPRAEDRSNWGPAKAFAMAAHEAGVDLTDEAARSAFMLRFNERFSARSTSANSSRAPWPFPGLLPKFEKPQPAAGPYDPCPCGSGRKYKFCCKGKR